MHLGLVTSTVFNWDQVQPARIDRSAHTTKAEGMRFTINLITPDNDEKFIIEMENATLTNIKGFLANKPDLTLTINRADLEQTMMGGEHAGNATRRRDG